MDPQQNDQNDASATLSDVERTSDAYLNGLQVKLQELRQKLQEEEIVSGQLEEIAYEQQGRISVHCQRSEELEAEKFIEMMNKAETELANAKEEAFSLSGDILGVFRNMILDVEHETGRMEGTRIQFKSSSSMEDGVELGDVRKDEVMSEITNVDNEILSTEKEDDERLRSVQSFAECDGLIEFYQSEMEEAEIEIANLSLKLRVVGRNASLRE